MWNLYTSASSEDNAKILFVLCSFVIVLLFMDFEWYEVEE